MVVATVKGNCQRLPQFCSQVLCVVGVASKRKLGFLFCLVFLLNHFKN